MTLRSNRTEARERSSTACTRPNRQADQSIRRWAVRHDVQTGTGQKSRDCKVSVRIAVYEGTATAAAARKDNFVSLTAAADAVAAAFTKKLNEMCARSASLQKSETAVQPNAA